MNQERVIPRVIWDVVTEKLASHTSTNHTTRTTSPKATTTITNNKGVWIRKLSYDVSRQEWGNECGCVYQQNLLFEYLQNVYKNSSKTHGNCSADNGIHHDFISVQFADARSNIQHDTHSHHLNSNHKNDGQRQSSSSSAITNQHASNISPTLRSYYYQADAIREQMLRNGLQSPCGKTYHLLGCSNSQVRNYSFIFRRVYSSSDYDATMYSTSKSKKKKKKNQSNKNHSTPNHLQTIPNSQFLHSLLPTLTKLEQTKGISKRIKYSGLLFSGVKSFVSLPKDTVIQCIPSVERYGFDFTDGVGVISLKLARVISKQLGGNNKRKYRALHNGGDCMEEDVPCVFQVRYGGSIQQQKQKQSSSSSSSSCVNSHAGKKSFVCKGILLVDPTETEEYILSFRPSMQKIALSNDTTNQWSKFMDHQLGIVDYSSPKVGKLNQQLLCLLSANVPHSALLELQNTHLDLVRNCWRDPFAMGYFAAMEEDEQIWNKYQELIFDGCSAGNNGTKNGENEESGVTRWEGKRLPSGYVSLSQRQARYCNNNTKFQMHLGQSRIVFGAAIPEQTHAILQENQCLFFTDQGLLVNDSLIVSRSPSYTPGDVRVLQSVDLPSDSPLRSYRNCILFSTNGERPESDKMSGGDMDGDMYLVIFDERLTKYSQVIGQAEAEDYSQSAMPPPSSTSSQRRSQAKEDWIEYMSRFDNSMLGIVDRAFYTTAKEKGITSPEAIQLNQMFTSLVDKNPASLTLLEKLIGSSYLSGKEKQLSVEDEGSSCVWEVMLQQQMDCGAEIRSRLLPGKEDYSIFRQCLLDDPMKIAQRVKMFRGHFQYNMRINTLESFVDNLTMMHDASKENVETINMPLTVSSVEPYSEISTDLHHRFQSVCKGWESKAKSVFSSALAGWDAKRKNLLAELSAERRKLDDQISIYSQIRMRLENPDVVRIKETNLLARDYQYASQLDQQREKLSTDKAKLKETLAYISDHLVVALEQEISIGVCKEIGRLSKLKVKYDSKLKDKKEELQTRGRSLRSFVGLDWERAEIMRVIQDLEQQRQTLLSTLAKVGSRQQLIANSGVTWKELPKFDRGESELLSEEFRVCLTKEAKLNKYLDNKESMKKQVKTHKRSIEELKWFADKVRTGEWRKLSSMIDTRDFTRSNTEFLVELNLEEKWKEAKRDMILIQEEQYGVDMDIHDLEEKVSALQSGKLFNEIIQFDVKKQEVEFNDYQRDYNHAQQRLIEATNLVKDTEKDLLSSKRNLLKIQSDLSSRIQLQEKLQLFFGLESTMKQLNNFGNEMVSQSSYHDLAALVHKFGEADLFWRKLADDFVCGKNDLNLSDVVEDNPVILHAYFESTKEIQETVSTERKLRLEEKEKQINEIKNKKCSVQNRCNRAKSLKSSLEVELSSIIAKQKKVNKQLKTASKEREENETIQNELLNTKQILLYKQKHFRSAIGTVSNEMKERKQDLTRLEQEIAQLQKHYKPILNRFETFVIKAGTYLDGELKKGIPSDVFNHVKDIVGKIDGLHDLKKIFEHKTAKKVVRGLDVSGDKNIFEAYQICVEKSRKMYTSSSLDRLQRTIDDEDRIVESISSTLCDLNAKMEMCQGESLRLDEEVKSSKGRLEHLKRKLRNTYSKEKMDELQRRWDDKGWEDSLKCAMQLIDRAIKGAKKDWSNLLNSTSEILVIDTKLEKVDKNIMRMIDIEENRILGFPKRNGERSGCMPVYDKRAELQQALKESNVVIITAGTGCGKSTQLPQYIIDDFYAHSPECQEHDRDFVRICCTQPRRLAAQGVASRVAEEYITSLGDMVGFRVGKRGNIWDSQKVGKNTRIEFVTEGLLLHQLTKSADKIKNYDCIIIDEAHERNKETDLLLARLKRFLNEPQYRLKVVVMSATIDPTAFSNYFGGVPTIHCPGRNYHVEEYYHPPILSQDKKTNSIDIDHAVDVLFDTILKKYGTSDHFETGDVLIFLSSGAQITACVDMINCRARKEKMPHVVAYPLFASMSEKDKDAAKDPNHRTGIDKVTNGKHELSRKIICCTNIAETSLTIDGVRFVIEGGYAKKPMYDHDIRSKAIWERKISQASAKQRKGRAGRTAEGRCYYLYSQSDYEERDPYDVPQIKDIPVDELIMYSLNVCGESIENLGLMDCPEEKQIIAAKERLSDLDMIEIEECGKILLTADGEKACKLSLLSPQAVRMILSARKPELSCLHRAIKLGAVLSSEEDISLSFGKADTNTENQELNNDHDFGDHLLALDVFEKFEQNKKSGLNDRQMRKWCKKNNLIYYTLERIQGTVEQSYKEMKKFKYLQDDSLSTPLPENLQLTEEECLIRAMISGYFSQIGEYLGGAGLNEMGFSMLSNTLSHINPRLAKESCLYKQLTSDEFFDEGDESDESDGESDSESECEQSQLKDAKDEFQKTAANFVIYSDMFSVELRNKNKLMLIPKVSLIDGKWIKQHAPESWCRRVEFDENKPTISRRTIRTVGRDLQLATLNFYKKSNFKDNLHVMMQILWENGKIIFYGKIEPLNEVVRMVMDLISNIQEKKIRQDVIYYNQDNAKFGSGLELKTIRNKDPVDGFLAKQAWKKSNNSNQGQDRYWHIKDQGSKLVTVFVNQGNDASIFCETLQALLSTHYKCKFIVGKVSISPTQDCAQQRPILSVVKETIHGNLKLFLPATLDVSSFTNVSEQMKCELEEIFQNLEYEWKSCIPFWRKLCKDMEKSSSAKTKVNIKYSPVSKSFELFSSKDGACEKVKDQMLGRLVNMCKLKNIREHKPDVANVSKWTLWRIAAVIGEARLKFPLVRITLMVKSSPHLEHCTSDNVQNGKDVMVSIVDVKRLLQLDDDHEFDLETISIKIQRSSSNNNMMSEAYEWLGNQLPSKIDEGGEESGIGLEDDPDLVITPDSTVEKKKKHPAILKCHLCKRVLHFEGKGKKEAKVDRDDIAMNEEGTTKGHKLELCGCAFCRECFSNSASRSLKKHGSVKCSKCKSIVLGRDCNNITNESFWKMEKNEKDRKWLEIQKLEADWKHIITMSYESYCSKFIVLMKTKAMTKCKNCDSVMLHDKSIKCIYCSNMKCGRLICNE